MPLGRDIGYLPGDIDEKLNRDASHLRQPRVSLATGTATRENPGFAELLGDGANPGGTADHIRGAELAASITSSCDEAQNLSPHEVKTIITRCGEGTKIVLNGDPFQNRQSLCRQRVQRPHDRPPIVSNANGSPATSCSRKESARACRDSSPIFYEIRRLGELERSRARLGVGQIRLIRSVTPDQRRQRARELTQAFRRGAPRLPRWRYDAPAAAARAFNACSRSWPLPGQGAAHRALYAARARELRLEAALVDAAGTPVSLRCAPKRFLGIGRADRGCAQGRRARVALDERSRGSAGASGRRTRGAADPQLRRKDPRSHRLSIGERGRTKTLPMRVYAQAGMASLAATGRRRHPRRGEQVALCRDVERTVLHENRGARVAAAAIGACPRWPLCHRYRPRNRRFKKAAPSRSRKRRLSRRGSQFELGCRTSERDHLAARLSPSGGAPAGPGAALESALRIAASVQRGSLGVGGLGREVVYLTARCKLERLVRTPLGTKIERVSEVGRIAADVALDLAAALSTEEQRQEGAW